MDFNEILAGLNSRDYLEVLDTLHLIGSKRNELSFEILGPIRKRLLELFQYEYPREAEEDVLEMSERIQREAVLILGLYFQDKPSFDSIAKLASNQSISDYLGSTVLSCIASLGGHDDLRKKALNVLARVSLSEDFSKQLRQEANAHILILNGKIKPQNHSKAVMGKLKIPFDEAWLKTFLS